MGRQELQQVFDRGDRDDRHGVVALEVFNG